MAKIVKLPTPEPSSEETILAALAAHERQLQEINAKLLIVIELLRHIGQGLA